MTDSPVQAPLRSTELEQVSLPKVGRVNAAGCVQDPGRRTAFLGDAYGRARTQQLMAQPKALGAGGQTVGESSADIDRESPRYILNHLIALYRAPSASNLDSVRK